MANSRDAAAYDAAVEATWRHSGSFELPLPVAQKDLVHYATLAANSHNIQPWRFRVADRAIFVLPDSRRRLPSVDPDDHHLFASLGCATENLVQAAAAFGLRANATFDAAAGGIRLDLEQAAPARSQLFDAIPRRQSTRSIFDGRAVPAEHLRLLEAAGSDDGVKLLLFTERKQIEDILGYLIAGNSAQMDDAAFIAELKSWLRFNYAEALATDDEPQNAPAPPPCRAGSDVSFSVLSSQRTARTGPMRPSSGARPASPCSSRIRTSRPHGARRGAVVSGSPCRRRRWVFGIASSISRSKLQRCGDRSPISLELEIDARISS